jgi:hypothetical protein
MIWRDITGEIDEYIDTIDEYEANGVPRWFRDSTLVWTQCPNKRMLVPKCQEIYGFFEDGLKAVVYVEKQASPVEMMLHFSVLGALDPAEFVHAASELRNTFLDRGVRHIRGWILKRNFALLNIMALIGFSRTGLKLDHGTSHGRVLRWELLEVRRG